MSVNRILARKGLLLFAALIASPASEAAVERPFPVVTVSGEGSVTVTPDIAITTAAVSTDARTTREAADNNARITQAVLDTAKQAGVADTDLRTARFSVAPIYTQHRDGVPPQVSGYRVTNAVTVRIRDLGRAGELLDALIGAGATNLGGLEFSVADPSRLADEAREAAMADARRKAELYARLAGAQLGRPVSIAESEVDAPRPLALRTMEATQVGAAPMAPGEQTLRVQVTVSFELNQ